jgi:hypothetical protein
MGAKIMGFLKHNLIRFIGVVVIGAILVGGPVVYYKYAFNKGVVHGYAKYAKEHPSTVVQGGTVIQNSQVNQKEPFALIKMWFLKLQTTF